MQDTTEKEELAKQPAREDDVPEKYKSEPVLVRSIRIKAEEEDMTRINGLTILDKELFVVTASSSEIEVYDSVNFSFSRRCNLEQLIYPADIVSCNRLRCLYISDFKEECDQMEEILRVDPHGNLILSWSTGQDSGWGLSVTKESNVILAVRKKNALKEYSPDGQLIREIDLLTHAGIREPLHAIKLTCGNFLVSHGWNCGELHRICVVDADGNLKKSFGREAGSRVGQMKSPNSLAVNGNGFVMVADCSNGRVLLLNSDLEFQKCILSKDGIAGLLFPWSVLLDESNSRLFVTEDHFENHGPIFIFQFS